MKQFTREEMLNAIDDCGIPFNPKNPMKLIKLMFKRCVGDMVEEIVSEKLSDQERNELFGNYSTYERSIFQLIEEVNVRLRGDETPFLIAHLIENNVDYESYGEIPEEDEDNCYGYDGEIEEDCEEESYPESNLKISKEMLMYDKYEDLCHQNIFGSRISDEEYFEVLDEVLRKFGLTRE